MLSSNSIPMLLLFLPETYISSLVNVGSIATDIADILFLWMGGGSSREIFTCLNASDHLYFHPIHFDFVFFTFDFLFMFEVFYIFRSSSFICYIIIIFQVTFCLQLNLVFRLSTFALIPQVVIIVKVILIFEFVFILIVVGFVEDQEVLKKQIVVQVIQQLPAYPAQPNQGLVELGRTEMNTNSYSRFSLLIGLGKAPRY